ncbi:aspartate/glutamate racemase family protein [Rhodospirillum sp. A1_3_36]|uniref:aspartate/glutamate racemase family protein n=1 Tax=Rhodospirillum sp. A1_3_36 TaxID=3391666 RepID=UPI0039A4D396
MIESQKILPSIGVMMLKTRFPRIPGDIGNPGSFTHPVILETVEAATVDRVVTQADRATALLPDFIRAAQSLERAGVAVISTSCGFLSIAQADVAAAVSVPVVSSGLMMVPLVAQMVGRKRRVGILTANADVLSEGHLRAVGIGTDLSVSIQGMETSEAFRRAILSGGAPEAIGPGGEGFDRATLERDVVDRGIALRDAHPDLGAIVLECTNLPPYTAALRAATGLPVFSIIDLLEMIATARTRGYTL